MSSPRSSKILCRRKDPGLGLRPHKQSSRFRVQGSKVRGSGVQTWRGENTHHAALNFYPIFIPLFEAKVSGVSVQDML
jgi:hypothetical protein